jgi:dual-specificity kinase
VTLEVGWSFASDIWSCGCIIAELLSGELLFDTHENLEHIALIEKLVGFFPWTMIKRSPVFRDYFHKDGEVRFENLPLESKQSVRRFATLSNWVLSTIGQRKWEQYHDDRHIYQLLRELLQVDPVHRIRAKDALKLPFFSD